MKHLRSWSLAVSGAFLTGAICLLAGAQPTIEFTVIPPAGGGNRVRLDRIEGRVHGASPRQRIVLFAQSGGAWWVQPLVSRPFTELQPDSRWKGTTHLGTVYAALLVDAQYVPPNKMPELPPRGGQVLAVAIVAGSAATAPKLVDFAGYPWRVREGGRSQAGQIIFYDRSNVSIGQDGLLHLRVRREGDGWTCAEVTLSRSLGFGSYRFVMRDISHLEPAAVLGIGPTGKMAIELGRWGRPEDKNAQYVIPPYTVPANVMRFVAPPGTLTHFMDWQSGRVAFQTVRGAASQAGRNAIAEHTFTSGIQDPGDEGVSLNLYVVDNTANPLKREFEVIVEKFEFLP